MSWQLHETKRETPHTNLKYGGDCNRRYCIRLRRRNNSKYFRYDIYHLNTLHSVDSTKYYPNLYFPRTASLGIIMTFSSIIEADRTPVVGLCRDVQRGVHQVRDSSATRERRGTLTGRTVYVTFIKILTV